jgi:hypothetical protein
MLSRNVVVFAFLLTSATIPQVRAGDDRAADMAALLNAYPGFLDRVDGNDLVWRDGTRMKIDGGRRAETLDAMLDDADIKDMFAMVYPLGQKGIPPNVDFDPGRVRSTPFFNKIYGDCHAAGFMGHAAKVVWLPGKYDRRLEFTMIDGAAAALQDVSNELTKLPANFMIDLRPRRGPTIAAPLLAPNVQARTVSALRSTSLRRIPTTGTDQSLMPAAAFLTRTGFLGRSSTFSRSTASSGAASGITTTRCISSIGPRS